MEVKVLRSTPFPEELIAKAMRGCRSIKSAYNLVLTQDDIQRLIRVAIKMGHESVLEHASITFGVEGVSRVLTHQLVRHRLASYSQQSLRRVKVDNSTDWYVLPKTLESHKRDFSNLLYLIGQAYNGLIKKGVSVESARYILPMAVKSNIVITMNFRELRHFLKLRLSPDAEWEIREMAQLMLSEAKKIAPTVFEDLGDKNVQSI